MAPVMLGAPGSGYHFEFPRRRFHPVVPTPTVEDLLVLYVLLLDDWQRACARMLSGGSMRSSTTARFARYAMRMGWKPFR